MNGSGPVSVLVWHRLHRVQANYQLQFIPKHQVLTTARRSIITNMGKMRKSEVTAEEFNVQEMRT